MRDRLYLLRPGFEDPAYPGQVFYCWHCALMEGVLASFPWLFEHIEVVRIDCQGHVAICSQRLAKPISLHHSCFRAMTPRWRSRPGPFVVDKDEILKTLSVRHGLPLPHP